MALQTPSLHSPYEGYAVGQILTLTVQPSPTAPATRLRVRVRRLQEPRTLSCSMVVDILDDSDTNDLPATAFLKLFDRRFADQLRKDYGIGPWTRDMEESYLAYVHGGGVHRFLHDLRHVEDFQEDTECGWDNAQNEAFLADQLLTMYAAETATYKALGVHQGRLVPKLFAEVNLHNPRHAGDEEVGSSEQEELLGVKGILLQFIQGFSLSELADKAPRSSWQDIVDQAIKIVHVLGDNNVLNGDVRPENFMISPNGDGGYQIYMIDFGLCRFRGKDESDLDWWRAKATKNEERAVGLAMKKRLKKHGFDLDYKYSERYDSLIQGKRMTPSNIIYGTVFR